MWGASRSHGSYLLLNARGPPQSCKAIRDASWRTIPFEDSFRWNVTKQDEVKNREGVLKVADNIM